MFQPTVWKSETDFERDVIRIGRSIWPNANVAGPVVMDDRERDGVFVTEEAVHIIECTTSRTKQKAIDDIDKSIKLARSLRKQFADKPIQCWFITSDEPTADQNAVVIGRKEFPVRAESYMTFRNRLIDANTYLNLRREYAFGSARNMKDGSARIDRDEYIPLDLLRINDSSVWSIGKIVDELLAGRLKRALLLGDFGAGKSMSLREIYLGMVDAYNEGRSSRFPVYINLRDHSGQPEPIEILERHARRIGFGSPNHIVRAWRAGYIVLVLDGFDELSSTGWMAFNARLRKVRFATVEAIRRFVDQSPPDAAVLVAGRASYFDNEDECLTALGISRDTASIFSLNDFSESQIAKYLYRFGVARALPQWLPGRPLLVGYLASQGVLSADGSESESDAGRGWNLLLGRICDREAHTHEDVDAATVRHLIEDLASVAREKGGLSAQLSPSDMTHSYRRVVGVEPDQGAETLLMRLPGLGPAPEGGGRMFVDTDFGSAAAAGDVTRFIVNPYGVQDAAVTRVKEVLQESGIAVAAHQVHERSVPHEKLYVALNAAVDFGDAAVPEHGLAVDVVKLIATGDFAEPKERVRVAVREVLIDELDLTNCPRGLAGVRFQDCVISTLYLPPSSQHDDALPIFVNGQIDHVEGRGSESDLLGSMFKGVSFGTFDELPATNAAVLGDPDLAIGLKALVTVLRKLFLQKGSGRKENAFFRGVPGIGPKIIDRVLNLVESADYAHRTKRGGTEAIWTPNRRMSGRAKAIVSAPNVSQEAIAVSAKSIGREDIRA